MHSTQQSFYDILGVPESASKEEIRKAYLALARKYHPDKTGGDKAAEERLKRINEAYDTLKNEERRRAYDAERRNPFAGMGAGGATGPGAGFGTGAGPGGFHWSTGDASGFSFHASGLDEGDFADMFEAFFGGGPSTRGGARHATHHGAPRPRRRQTRGADITVPLTLTLEEIARGPRKRIDLTRQAACTACGGSGVAAGGAACTACRGRGTVPGKASVSVQIPPGVADGARLRIAGQGHAGAHGGPPGDLIVTVHQKPHEWFVREGDNLVLEYPLAFPDAALGATVRVPTLTGQADLRIPAGTQPGRQFRMRGLGLPRARGGKGDLIVRVTVEIPTRLSAEQRRIVEQLAGGSSSGEAAQYPQQASFVERLKRYLDARAVVIALGALAGWLLWG